MDAGQLIFKFRVVKENWILFENPEPLGRIDPFFSSLGCTGKTIE